MQLKIKSQTEKLSTVREFVSEAARQFGFDEESVGKVALAVDEACTNVIKHSYEFAPHKEINIKIVTNGDAFEVIITHQGKSFDPQAIKSPDMREYLSHFRRGGLGMHLMRSLMDKVEYRTLSDKKSEVRLIKHLPANVSRS
ncbi:MAG: ATP-binding protein [Ignavibacteria bacterium]|nr:ATP-binding protein [Ignavibacteria bacterium]